MDVISAARIPEVKPDDMNIMMVVALSNCILGGLLRVAYNLREKRGTEPYVHQWGSDEKREGERVSTHKKIGRRVNITYSSKEAIL